MINWLPPYKTVAEYMQMDSVLNESSASEICQWCRSTTTCKMQAVSPCTCSRLREKTPDLSPLHKDTERSNPPKNRIRLFIELRSTKPSQAATLLSSYVHFLFLLIIQKRSCIRSLRWSIWPHILSLAVAKT